MVGIEIEMNIGKQQLRFRQTIATDEEMEKLKETTNQPTNQDAIREAVLRVIKGAESC